MKKKAVWVLLVIIGVAFFSLLYLQIEYISQAKKMRTEHFDDAVRRSLYEVAKGLELDQTKKYLHNEILSKTDSKQRNFRDKSIVQKKIKTSSGDYDITLNIQSGSFVDKDTNYPVFSSPGLSSQSDNAVMRASSSLQEDLIRRYTHERENVDQLVAKILEVPSIVPIAERVNFKELENDLKEELQQNGIELPFYIEIVDRNNKTIFKQAQFNDNKRGEIFSQVLFPNDPPEKLNWLKVSFPTRSSYIMQEVSFLLPAIIFTVILLVTFIIILVIIFREKRLSEMKTDFVNNMTHELKTPVSTISLAAQMLKDPDVTKSPTVFSHISSVINDETARLSFQVEKVLQMSLFEKQKATLKLKPLDLNDIIAHVANTFELKVKKVDGTIDIDLEAMESTINADKMHITNVLFNLLDNALKYRREDVNLDLMIRTWNPTANKLCISVEDNGIGIKKNEAKKIFDRFYRVSTGNRHDVKGFGLGLAYVKKIVVDHKGSIRAESNTDGGAKFIITLPVYKEKNN